MYVPYVRMEYLYEFARNDLVVLKMIEIQLINLILFIRIYILFYRLLIMRSFLFLIK